MNLPTDTDQRARLAGTVDALIRGVDGPLFLEFVGWIRSERDERDRENRIRERGANQTTEAHALSVIVEFVDSVWSPDEAEEPDELPGRGNDTGDEVTPAAY